MRRITIAATVLALPLAGTMAWRLVQPRVQEDATIEAHIREVAEPIIRFQAAELDAYWSERAERPAVARPRPGRNPGEDLSLLLELVSEHGCPELRDALEVESKQKTPKVQRELLDSLWQVRFRQSEVAYRSTHHPRSRSAQFEEELVFQRLDVDRARLIYGLVHPSQPELRTGEIQLEFRYGLRGLEWLPLGWCLVDIVPSINRSAVHEIDEPVESEVSEIPDPDR